MLPRRLHNQLTVTLRTEAGHQFKGEFGDPNGFPRPRREVQNIPHRALTVSSTSIARDGDVVDYRGSKFLLCGQHHLTNVRIFLALEVQQEVRWTRMGEGFDPILLVKKDNVETTLAERLPVILDPIRYLEELKFQKPVYRLLTGQDVQEGDVINGRLKVLQVSELLGLRVAELA